MLHAVFCKSSVGVGRFTVVNQVDGFGLNERLLQRDVGFDLLDCVVGPDLIGDCNVNLIVYVVHLYLYYLLLLLKTLRLKVCSSESMKIPRTGAFWISTTNCRV